MMRSVIGLLLVLLSGAATATDGPRYKPTGYWSEVDFEKLINNPPDLSSARLPWGYKIGRCLLVVNGQTRISGKCAYEIYRGGEFHVEGPRQVYDGIDYPKAQGMADKVSTDYWADVFKDDDGSWTGYGNEDISSVHGEGPNFGPLRRDGACLVSKAVRVCLWKK